MTENGRTLTAEGPTCEDGLTLLTTEDGATRSWAAGSLLPTSGTCSWLVRIERCRTGRMVIGVCDAAGVCGWGMEPCSGALVRHTRDGLGEVNLLEPACV